MIRHLSKLVWHRRRANLLVVLEIFVSFLVLFPVAGLGLFYWRNSTQPVGYDWSDVWVVSIDTGARLGGENAAEDARTLERLLATARSIPEVRSAAATDIAPFGTSTSETERNDVSTLTSRVTADFLDTLDLELVAGRWFGPEDDGLAFRPVVVDRDLARTLWGEEDPLGRAFPIFWNDELEERVVGVVAEYKKDGELAGPGNFTFYGATADNGLLPHLDQLVIEMEPGTTAATERRVLAALAATSPGWTLDMKPLASLRAESFRMRVVPLAVGATVALFLLAMVGLGLTGVLWQSITERRPELGLRRALGASRAAVRQQVLLEVGLLTAIAVTAGLALVIQLPLFELVGILDRTIFGAALAVTIVSIFTLTLLSSLYPSRLATRVEPATALHDE